MKLSCVHLSKGFRAARGTIHATRNINLEIADKEFFVLLGPSGCGKSTILNLIAGLEKPTAGEIWFNEKLVASVPQKVFLSPKERNVAMVFQSYALYPHLSVFENIAFPLKIAGEGAYLIQESVQKAASMLGISSLLTAKPAELSGGQRQRVAIARAIVRRPNLFLLDEPLSNLDAQLRTSTRIELKKLQHDLGITTIYVTHDQVEAMSLGDRIALLKDGQLEQVGRPEQLYEQPANAFVARFIGSPPMNLLRASLKRDQGQIKAVISGQSFTMTETGKRVLDQVETGECLMGVRPEHLAIATQDHSGSVLSGKLDSVESLGRDILLHASVDQQQVTALATEAKFSALQTGSSIQFAIDMQKVQIFRIDGNQEALVRDCVSPRFIRSAQHG